MKKFVLATCMLFCLGAGVHAQSVALAFGDLKWLAGEKVLRFEFTYEDMQVGKMSEAEYVEKKVKEYNEKEAGRGDTWRKAWVDDRKNRFEPKFTELFDKYMAEKGITSGDDGAKYVVKVNTSFTEPGFNVGVVRRNAAVDVTCSVFEIETGKKVAVIKVRNASANSFWGADFDSGYRLQESYAKAGRELAKFMIKKAKLK